MFVEFLQVYLPIIINILLVVLLVVVIIIGFKAMNLMDKANEFIDNVSSKIRSLNGLFNVIDIISDSITNITDKVVDGVMNLFKKFGSKKKKIKKEEE